MLIKSMFNANRFDIAREMDRLFETMMAPLPGGLVPPFPERRILPAVNLWEDEHHLHVEAELPGLTMDEIEVFATDIELTIKGERRIDVPENAEALRRERGTGRFERTIGLPLEVDVESIEARLRDGVLSITLPKSPTHAPRKIEVKTLTSEG